MLLILMNCKKILSLLFKFSFPYTCVITNQWEMNLVNIFFHHFSTFYVTVYYSVMFTTIFCSKVNFLFHLKTNKTWEHNTARSLTEYVATDKSSNTKEKQMLVINTYKLHNIHLKQFRDRVSGCGYYKKFMK